MVSFYIFQNGNVDLWKYLPLKMILLFLVIFALWSGDQQFWLSENNKWDCSYKKNAFINDPSSLQCSEIETRIHVTFTEIEFWNCPDKILSEPDTKSQFEAVFSCGIEQKIHNVCTHTILFVHSHREVMSPNGNHVLSHSHKLS